MVVVVVVGWRKGKRERSGEAEVKGGKDGAGREKIALRESEFGFVPRKAIS